jgi:ATP-dependent DNA ligase
LNGYGVVCSRSRPIRLPLEVLSPRQPLRITASAQPVHWVQPEFLAEVKFLTWTDDNLLRQVV